MTPKTAAFFLVLAFALAGCGAGSGAALASADSAAQKAYVDCDAQRRAGVLTSYRQSVECARPKVIQAYQEIDYPYTDLVQLDLAARQTGAEAIDSGIASAADVTRDLTVLSQRLGAEADRRNQMRSNVFSGPVTNTPPQVLLAGLSTLGGGGGTPARPGSNCFSLGNSTHCD